MVNSASKKVIKKKIFSFKPPKIKIKIIGLGAGGNSIISEIAKTIKGLSFFAIDTDPRSFRGLSKKIKIFQLEPQFSQFFQEEKNKTKTEQNLKSDEKFLAALKEKIKKIFQDADLIILITCLGGRISSHFLPIFSQVLESEKKLSLGIFVLPFSFEDERKISLAKNNLRKIKENFSGIVILENDRILKQTDKNISLRKCFSLMNQILAGYLQDVLELFSEAGIINIDFADFQTILKGKGQLVYFSRGRGQGQMRIEEALKELLENPFLKLPFKIKKILFNIKAGQDLTLKEVEKIGREIFNLNPQAKIIFGISQNSKFTNKIKITLLAAGDDLMAGKEKEEKLKEKEEATSQEKVKIKPLVKLVKKKKQIETVKKKIKKEKNKIQRRSALEIKKIEEKSKENKEEQETKWEIPSFLRNIV